MKWLLVGDTHLSDRPKDEYRFGLFKWLATQQKDHDTTATFFLGDLTQDKDNHSSLLVNRIVDELTRLKPPVIILRGNHDGIDPTSPYFRFLNSVPGVTFCVSSTRYMQFGTSMVPHCRSSSELEAASSSIKEGDYVFCHQTFDGAISEFGRRLSGLQVGCITKRRPKAIYAGDVHRPQTQGLVTYVGAPYPVRFGDNYESRICLLTATSCLDLIYGSPRKLILRLNSVDDLADVTLNKGDQVKVEVSLSRDQLVDWQAIKRSIMSELLALGVEVHGISLQTVSSTLHKAESSKGRTNADLVKALCKAENTSKAIKEAGLALIGE